MKDRSIRLVYYESRVIKLKLDEETLRMNPCSRRRRTQQKNGMAALRDHADVFRDCKILKQHLFMPVLLSFLYAPLPGRC